ncbi:hypothetical protein LR48_Vigan197s000300 [Vigna angularis]|uniref:Uncharacterized protein n=1 Tax=Phaseolus angularis TaxID=3914 RepID=A0A0L9T6U9_PHAAN|nr:hypothetical protein LR48_Vigan197s000300 [Vigna angularis]
MMASSSSQRGKLLATVEMKENPEGWFSDEEKRKDFVCFWGFKEVISHKYLSIQFFRTEGFMFQEWLVYSGLSKFVELEGEYYPNLVKVFYANIKRRMSRMGTWMPFSGALSVGCLASTPRRPSWGAEYQLPCTAERLVASFRAHNKGAERQRVGLGLSFQIYLRTCTR